MDHIGARACLSPFTPQCDTGERETNQKMSTACINRPCVEEEKSSVFPYFHHQGVVVAELIFPITLSRNCHFLTRKRHIVFVR